MAGQKLILRSKLWGSSVAIIMVFNLALVFLPCARAQTIMMAYCSTIYTEKGECPENICKLSCAGNEDKKDCQPACLPEDCTVITADQCPSQYCVVMDDCAGEKICHYPMGGEPAECGDLAYAGQNVECCEGLVRRCGIEFLEGICEMEGKRSVYNLPICIPCGDGICGQFENRCSCPEDCGEPFIPLPE